MPKGKKKVEGTEEEVKVESADAAASDAGEEVSTEKKEDFAPVQLKKNGHFKLWQTGESAFHIKNERDQVIANFSDLLEAEDTLRNLTR